MYYNYVKCPSCDFKINCDKVEFDGENEIDHICTNCDEEIELTREWFPSYKAHKITYETCSCGTTDRTDNLVRQVDKYLCKKCYLKKEISKLDKKSKE